MKSYSQALKDRFVKAFVKDNNRAPNRLEIEQGLANLRKEYVGLEEVGFANVLVTKPGFGSESSASAENLNRDAIDTDLSLAYERINDLASLLENSSRGLFATIKNVSQILGGIESRVDNLLLLVNASDIFVHGIEENFTVQDKIDFSTTTASIEAGFCTLARSGFNLLNNDGVLITHKTVAERGYIGVRNTSATGALVEDDGSFWEHIVYTNYLNGRVSVILDMILPAPAYVSQFRFVTGVIGINSKSMATVFYTLDGNTWAAVEPHEAVLVNNENLFGIGVDGVKGIRLLLSKDKADMETQVANQHAYIFSLDSVKLYAGKYSSDTSAMVYAGPYDVLDEEGNAVKYTKLTADVCLTKGDLTGVSLAVSGDGITYYPVNIDNTGLHVATIANNADTLSRSVIDDTNDADTLVSDSFIELQANESLINTCIGLDYVNDYNRRTLAIKRNIVAYDSLGVRLQPYGTDSGWIFNPVTKRYRTTVYVGNPNGVSINLGATSAYVNNVLMSGMVLLKSGYSIFETNASNYSAISGTHLNESSLKAADPLYPYNHKYLIEGFGYADTFFGEKVYLGVEEYFGALMKYEVPELFLVPENSNNFDIYTTDITPTNLVFKVKVNKGDATWDLERYSASWTLNTQGYDKIWFKLGLQASDTNISPVVSSVKIRVI